MNIAYRNY